MNWEEIDKIERVTPKHEPKERKDIAPSVQEELNKFDKLDKRSLTEGHFHQDNAKAIHLQERNYIQKALRKTLAWQSFCRANT